ncbi:hypothetical protein L1049_013829 [Liquidambar formosana]|uniref:Uncharacterized protein n=1 Tax=Liquidambar formosana TaxID=63359 RepID=A0AAP0RPH4_LIQFO
MRFLAVALILMMVSSCVAVNMKALVVEMREQEQRHLVDDEEGKAENSAGSSVNNHHYIPRQDFNNYVGTPKGGGDDSGNGSG